MSRHVWTPTRPWQSVHDVRRCRACAIRARRRSDGSYEIDRSDWPRQRVFTRMPACPTSFRDAPARFQPEQSETLPGVE